MHHRQLLRWSRPAMFAAATLAVLLSCEENLPTGPDAFTARLEIGVTSDTIVVGDSSKAQARAVGPNGVLISDLTFSWTTSNGATLGLASSDEASARTRTLVAIKPGQSVVTLSLPDKRFTTTSATRNETVVVGGVKVLSTRDSTLTAINDTGTAIATSLVKVNGALVNRASQGIRWIHQGTRTTVVGTGDTIRYIARVNGADTLIATHDFCLKSAKCADTVIVRVSQSLTMSLSGHSFKVWSFSDSVGPTVTLADRRGNGLAGTSVRFVPMTAADSVIVKVTPPIGTSNPTTGLVAAPRLVSTGNGTAHVLVLGIAPDGSTVVAGDTISETVRQVARRVLVEPLRATVSVVDSLPVAARARDARGAIIADATTGFIAVGTAVSESQVGPNPANTATSLATLTPTITGVALPDSNPQAPQVEVTVLPSIVSLIGADTVKAGATGRVVTVTLLDSTGAAVVGAVVRFDVAHGIIPAPAVSDGNGVVQVAWFPKDSTGSYTLTGVRDLAGTPAVSTGAIVIRRSVVVVAGAADAVKTTIGAGATTIAQSTNTTITVTVRDAFNNPVLSAVPGDLTMAATAGTLSAGACTNGVCTFTYTAPASAGPATITAKLGAADVTGSPLAMTITP
jgi:hypothetical protein